MIDVDSHRRLQSEEDDCRSEDGISSSKKSSSAKEKSDFNLGIISSSSSSSCSSSSSSSSDDCTPNSVSDSFPNFMKTTTSSEARRNYFQKSLATAKSSKTLKRMSSLRFKRILIRKSSDDRKLQSPVTSPNSKLGNRNNRIKIRDVSSVYSKSNSMISGIMLTRKPSLRPVRKLAKLAASKSKKYSNMETSNFHEESCAKKATCSSVLKGSKLPGQIELQPGEGKEFENLAVKKICPYSYCSLHGHSHGNAPPLKRFKSIRKRALRAQKNKSETEPSFQTKRSENRKKSIRARKIVNGEDLALNEMMTTSRPVFDAEEESGPSVLMDINSGEVSYMEGKGNFDVDECSLEDGLGSSACGCEQIGYQSKANETLKGYDLATEIDSLSRTSSCSSISLNITAEVREINSKYVRMWQLVYKNVMDSNSGNADNEQPLIQVKETSKEVANVDEREADMSPDAAAYRKLELFKNEAIKLVQEAFDRILLPEIQDQSPRPREENSREKLKRPEDEVRGPSFLMPSSSTRSVGEDLAYDQEGPQTQVENTSMEERKTKPTIENRSNQPVPNRWSNLKKLILLKRFVKALEKVRKINPQKSRYLPFKLESEGEKVYLQRQSTEERKKSEEWMLDYAVQQVISKLEPAQKKRVSLLIEAFETVLPVPRDEAHIRNKVASPADHYQVHGASDGTDKNEGINLEHLEKSEQDEAVHKTIGRGCRVGEIAACNLDEVESEATLKNCHPKSVDTCLPEVKDAILVRETSKKPDDTSFQEVSVNGRLLKISKRVISRVNSELFQNGYMEPDQTIFKNDSLISVTGGESDTSKNLSLEVHETPTVAKSLASEDHEKSTKVDNFDRSPSAYELLEKTRAAIFNRSRTAQSKVGSTGPESIPLDEIDIDENETKFEEKKNASMWFLIYKHMASSIDAKDGSKPRVGEETGKDENETSSRRQNMEMKDMFVNDSNVELQCIEAVKLVNEAIDEIPLPENSTSPHDRSFFANLNRDRALVTEEKRDASEESDRRREAEDTTVSDPDEVLVNPVDVKSQEDEKEQNLRSKSNQQVLKNWSNLKKVILLNRFIKAMEKVKKFNPRRPNFLPMGQDAESEKVQLRHQDTEDRKNAEEWMLDYALQQAVAKLSPARKRKVELLVQAFETVNPTV